MWTFRAAKTVTSTTKATMIGGNSETLDSGGPGDARVMV